MTSSWSIMAISFFSNWHAFRSALYGTDRMGSVSFGNNWILWWAALVLPEWPSNMNSHSDRCFKISRNPGPNHSIFYLSLPVNFRQVTDVSHLFSWSNLHLKLICRFVSTMLILIHLALNVVVSLSRTLRQSFRFSSLLHLCLIFLHFFFIMQELFGSESPSFCCSGFGCSLLGYTEQSGTLESYMKNIFLV